MCVTSSEHRLSNEFIVRDLYVEITNKCNLYCKYCCRNSSYNENREMPTEIFDKLLLDAKKLGCRNITLTGGEAILHHDFERMFEQCIDLGYDVYLLSNGIELKKLPRHFLHKIKKIQISIDGGSAQDNDRTRGAGTFFDIVKAIEYLLEERMPPDTISLKMTITHENIGGITSLILFAAEYGIKNIGFSFLYNAGRAATLEEELFVTEDDKNNIIHMLEEARIKYPDMDIQSPGYTDKCPLLKEDGEISLMPRISCTGKVYACQMFSDEFWIGDLFFDNLADIIKGARFESLRTLALNRENFMDQCQTCALKRKCGKGCVAISLFDGVTATDGDCCLREMHNKRVRHMAVKWIRERQEMSTYEK